MAHPNLRLPLYCSRGFATTAHRLCLRRRRKKRSQVQPLVPSLCYLHILLRPRQSRLDDAWKKTPPQQEQEGSPMTLHRNSADCGHHPGPVTLSRSGSLSRQCPCPIRVGSHWGHRVGCVVDFQCRKLRPLLTMNNVDNNNNNNNPRRRMV